MHASVLRYFLEVARQGSIRKAAQKLFVASSAVNRQILQLEAELGAELFDRLPTGMRLNAAGECVLRHVRSTLHDFELLRSELDAQKGEKTGHVSLVAMDSLFFDLLPTAVDEFADDFPAVTFTLLAMAPSDVPHKVAAGEADIGICFVTRAPPGTEIVASVPLPIGVVMATSHPLASRAKIRYDECRGLPILLSHGRWPIYDTLAPAYAEFWDSIVPRISSNSSALLKRAVVAGRGIAFFSRLGFLREIANGEAVWRPLDDPAINKLRVGLIVGRGRELPYVVRAFQDRLVRRIAELGETGAVGAVA
jgi:DNA-binding transcriptional LysR family regulator